MSVVEQEERILNLEKEIKDITAERDALRKNLSETESINQGLKKKLSEIDSRGVTPERNPWKKAQFNLTEQARIVRDEPERAERLKEEAMAS